MSIERSYTKTLRYVSVLDPAVDSRDENVERLREYLESASPDIASLPMLGGATPAVFELAPPTMKQRARIRQMGDDKIFDKAIEAVACCLVSVTGYVVNGEPVRVVRHKVSGEERVKAEVLELLFDEQLFVELASRVLSMDRLNPTMGSR
jgi:hypothetical protein